MIQRIKAILQRLFAAPEPIYGQCLCCYCARVVASRNGVAIRHTDGDALLACPGSGREGTSVDE